MQCIVRGIRASFLAGGGVLFLAVPSFAQRDHQSVSITLGTHLVSWHEQGSVSWEQEAPIIPFRQGSGTGTGYTSLDPRIITEHIAEMEEYNLTPLISWWGRAGELRERSGDLYLDAYLSMSTSLKAMLLYENTGRLNQSRRGYDFDDPDNAEQFVSDMVHLREKYFSEHPDRFFLVDGRPVVFIWASGGIVGNFAAAADRARREADVFIIGSEYGIHGPREERLPIIRAFDAISSYGTYWPDITRRYGGHANVGFTAQHISALIAWSAWLQEKASGVALVPPLMFAFDDTQVRGRPYNPPLTSTPEEAAYQAEAVRALVEAAYEACSNILPIVLFVSYNEHYEGSSLEPTDRYGYDFLEVIRAVFGQPIAQRARTCRPF